MAEFQEKLVANTLLALKILLGIIAARSLTLFMGDRHYLPVVDDVILFIAYTLRDFGNWAGATWLNSIRLW